MNIAKRIKRKIERGKERLSLAMPVRTICDYNRALVMAGLVNKDLAKYKGIYSDRDVYIIGGGPSVKTFNYKKSDSDIFIGINNAYKDSRLEFDYLFKQDQLQDELDDFLNYRGKDCIKFLAIVPNDAFYRIKEFKVQGDYERYVLASRTMKEVPFDISLEPVADLRGTVFSALQFAVYTNAKNIYLVGIDCSNGNVYNGRNDDYRYQMEGWSIIKKALINMTAFDRVASVNPVGLKGVFRDIYM